MTITVTVTVTEDTPDAALARVRDMLAAWAQPAAVPATPDAEPLADFSGDDEGSGLAPSEEESPAPAKRRGRPPKARPAEPPAAPAPVAETDEAMHKRAQEILMSVFARGEAGAAEVRRIRDALGVKKFIDVPFGKARELLALAEAADAAVPVS